MRMNYKVNGNLKMSVEAKITDTKMIHGSGLYVYKVRVKLQTKFGEATLSHLAYSDGAGRIGRLNNIHIDNIIQDIAATYNSHVSGYVRFCDANNITRLISYGLVSQSDAEKYYLHVSHLVRTLDGLTRDVKFIISSYLSPHKYLIFSTKFYFFESEDITKVSSVGHYIDYRMANDDLVRSFMKNTHKIVGEVNNDISRVMLFHFGYKIKQ